MLYGERELLQGRAKGRNMMREMKAGEERDRARFSATRLLEDLDEQWPSMKFLVFGAYYEIGRAHV